jgi:two-component system, NarL family, nitrate/nitrite response regulator NarL
MKSITVLLAEDHMIVREGLRVLLSLEGDIEVVGEAANGHQSVELALKLSAAVVVMDIAMPMLNGLEATRQIHRVLPATKVLILSAHSDDAYVEQAMTFGAAGYLVKQTAAHVLPEAIRRIHEGHTFFSPSISMRLNHHQQKAHKRGELPTCKDATHLTSREVEVLQLVAEGNANKETAQQLHVSVKTVEKHRQSLMEKLNIHETAGLTRYAVSAGIIDGTSHLTARNLF